MKPSPVQLLRLWFEKVSVEVDPKNVAGEDANSLGVFSFEKVILKTAVGIAEVEDARTDGHFYQVSFELIVDNKKTKKSKQPQFCPYLISMTAFGIVRVPSAASKLAPVRDLALVNGAALLWSAMREQVAFLTSRMPPGQVLLPTVHFQDLRSDLQPKLASDDEGSRVLGLPETNDANYGKINIEKPSA